MRGEGQYKNNIATPQGSAMQDKDRVVWHTFYKAHAILYVCYQMMSGFCPIIKQQ